MLAYAAQGLPHEAGSVSGSQIRDFLRKCDAALTGLAEAVTNVFDGSAGSRRRPITRSSAWSTMTRAERRRPFSSCSRSHRSARSSWTT